LKKIKFVIDNFKKKVYCIDKLKGKQPKILFLRKEGKNMNETKINVNLNNYEIEVLLNALLNDCKGMEKNNEFNNFDTDIENVATTINYLIDKVIENKGQVRYSKHD
jgi:hypothetical protein